LPGLSRASKPHPALPVMRRANRLARKQVQPMAGALDVIQRGYGIARSAVIYHGNPLKRRARVFYRAFVRPGDLCFDIGAHLGDRTGHFLALGARVVAVEPQPALAALLRRRHGRNPRVAIVAAAAGAAAGEAELTIDPMNPTVASLSPEWRGRIARAPRFAGIRWRERRRVAVTTLDALIAAYGAPAFCKIDVEGFEAPVLAGLTQPIEALSFEYIPAAIEDAMAALARVAALGRYRFNRSTGETMRFTAPQWRGGQEMAAELSRLAPSDPSGDVYARLAAGPP
jgi:FkbM family methyltransferase